ncbi:MAG: hypothetical protein IAF94_27000 [Pirellulaceae bacterium]|nr:hypothetical protein [Pirellulaceae bacterium]
MPDSNPELRDWQVSLKQKSLEELRAELSLWKNKVHDLGHPRDRKGSAKRVLDVEREIARRYPV